MWILITVGGDGLAFFDNGSSSSDSFSPLLSSFIGFVGAAARFERCGVVLLFALFFAGAFFSRFGDSFAIEMVKFHLRSILLLQDICFFFKSMSRPNG